MLGGGGGQREVLPLREVGVQIVLAMLREDMNIHNCWLQPKCYILIFCIILYFILYLSYRKSSSDSTFNSYV